MANTIDILIKAKDQASAEIKKVTGSLDDMNKDGGQSSENLGDSFGDMVGTITTLAAVAAAAIAVFKEALEFSEEGAAIARVQDSSAALAKSMGFDMDEIVAKVSAASLNTISDLDIMSSAAKAMMLGVGSSAGEMATLMEVAAYRGRALGMDATTAFDTIVRGIGRLSNKVLDNLGIIIDADETYAAYAESIGKSASELTEMEKRQALVNAVIADTAPLLAESGGLAEDSAAAWEQMSAAQKNFWDNLKADAADLMVWWPKFWADFYDNMNASRDIPELRKQLNDLMQSLLASKEITKEEYQSVMQMAYAHREASDSVEVLNGLLEMYGDEAGDATNSTEKLTGAQLALAAGIDLTSVGSERNANMVRSLSDEFANWKEATDAAAEAQAKLNAEIAAVTSLDTGYKTIMSLAENYTGLLEEKETLQIERQKLISNGWSEQSNKVKDLTEKIDEVDKAMADLASNMALDMFAASIAIGGVTDGEMQAYLDMAVNMGIISQEAADLAMQAWLDAKATVEGNPINAKITVDDHEVTQWEAPAKYGLIHYRPADQYIPEAAGGAVQAAASGLAASLPHYWVGELGPEPFFPATNGRIVSNTQALAALRGGGGGGGGETVVVNINTPMNFADKAWVERALAPYIQKAIREAAIRG